MGKQVCTPDKLAEFFDFHTPGLSKSVRDTLLSHLEKRDAGYHLATDLPQMLEPDKVAEPNPDQFQRAWEICGVILLEGMGRGYEALPVFESLYLHMLKAQDANSRYYHKGMPLIYMSDCFFRANHLVHARRYLMYTLCEDAAAFGPDRRVNESGLYFRAVWRFGVSDDLVSKYTALSHGNFVRLQEKGWFPERLLGELDNRWMTDSPSEVEFSKYFSNPIYMNKVLSQLGKDRGHSLEWLAYYLLSMIPGARVYRRQSTKSSEFDVVGSFEGPTIDFRSELGRYFVCECKDWNKPADFSTIAKFARVLDSVKSRFGILFSRKGITGKGKTINAEREQLKVFADRGIAIVVISEQDLRVIAAGGSFLSMVRSKYESVRLDLR